VNVPPVSIPTLTILASAQAKNLSLFGFFFQLDEIVIDVVEYIRDVEMPNMTVIKTELFPMSIGTTLDPRDRDFNEIPGLPRHKANVGVQYKARNNTSIALFAQAYSSQKVIYNNNTLCDTDQIVRRQAGYLRLDLEGRYPPKFLLGYQCFFSQYSGRPLSGTIWLPRSRQEF